MRSHISPSTNSTLVRNALLLQPRLTQPVQTKAKKCRDSHLMLCPIASQTTTCLQSHLPRSRAALTNATPQLPQRSFWPSAATAQTHHDFHLPTFFTPLQNVNVTLCPGVCTLTTAVLDIRSSAPPCARCHGATPLHFNAVGLPKAH